MTTAILLAALQISLTAPARNDLTSDLTMQPRTYSTGVSLVRQGQPCTIIYPAGEAWRRVAERLALPISHLAGTKVPLLADTEAIPTRLACLPVDLRTQPLIILGNLSNNRAIFPLYANYYTYCDAIYPGDNGSLLQTIVRPFGGPSNFLIVGGSSMAGVEHSVDILIHRLGKLHAGREVELPYCLDVELGQRMANLMQPSLNSAAQMQAPSPDNPNASLDYKDARDAFTTCAHLYFYTGRLDIAQQAKDWAMYLAKTDRGGFRTADYSMEILAAAWRRISTAPVFSPEELALVDSRIYGTAASQNNAWWRQKGAIPEIGGRHHTTGMFAWWELIRCLLELGQPTEDTRQTLVKWQEECEGYLDGLMRHYWDDLDDYQSADGAQNTCSYVLQTGKLEWFHNGMAKRAAEKLLALTDNQGWYTGVQGYGEALPGWERFTLNGGLLLGACAFVYDDDSYRALFATFPSLRSCWGALQPWGLHEFEVTDTATKSKPPEWFAGLNVLRLTPYRLDLMNKGVFLNSPLMDGFAVAGIKPPGIPDKLIYDKAVFRNEPPGPFLLLQGMSGIALSTIDMNSIIRYTDEGHIWLVHNTGRRSLFFKNAVYVSNGLNDESVPAACELLAHAKLGNVAMLTSRLPDYRGTAWTRNIVLVKGATVIIDQIRANRSADYTVSCNWRTPDWATFGPGGWTSNQDGVEFHILPGELTGANSERFATADGATRPTVLREVRQFHARPGDDLFFENLLYTGSKLKEIRRLAPGAIIAGEKNHPESITLFAAGSQGLKLMDLETDASIICVSGDSISLLQATTLRFKGNSLLSSKERVNRQLNDPQVHNYLLGLWNLVVNNPLKQEQASTSKTGLKPVWTSAGPSVRGQLIDGIRLTGMKNFHGSSSLATDWILPTLVAEPRLSPQRGSSLTAGSNDTTDLEPMLDPLENSEFSLRLPRLTTIAEIEVFGATGKEISTPMPPNRLELELLFSNDSFNKDVRKRVVTTDRQTTWHNLYKGHGYAFETYRIDGLDESAAEVRVRVIKPTGRMPLNDIRVRTKGQQGQQMVQTRVIDLDGDGQEEILAWTPDGECCSLRADGTDIWRRDFGTGILAVDAWDLESDGRKEVFVCTTHWRIFCFNLDGTTRWEANWADMNHKLDGAGYGDGSLVFGVAAWERKGKSSKGRKAKSKSSGKELLLTSYFCAARANIRGEFIEAFSRSGYNTQIRPIPEGLPYAGGLVTRSDIPWNGAVPAEWLDPKTGKTAARCDVPNGPSVLFEVGDYTGHKQPEILVATEQGIGIYTPSNKGPVWEHLTEAALTGAAVLPPDEPGQTAQIVYGRQDGYLFVVSADGKLLRQLLLDEPIHCLTALRSQNGKAVVMAGTTNDLRCLSLDGLREQWRLAGEYQSLTPLKQGRQESVVAVKRNGTIERFNP